MTNSLGSPEVSDIGDYWYIKYIKTLKNAFAFINVFVCFLFCFTLYQLTTFHRKEWINKILMSILQLAFEVRPLSTTKKKYK